MYFKKINITYIHLYLISTKILGERMEKDDIIGGNDNNYNKL
jgi:hypothetical protein